jgi:hypothetical protein
LALTSALLLAVLVPANAANVTLTSSNTTSGQSGFTTGSNWSNGAVPSAAHDYFVNNNFVLRTPQPSAVSSTFGGNSLTINGGSLGLANLRTGGSETIINNFTLTGGGFLSNFTSGTQTVSGTLNIDGSAFARLHTANSSGAGSAPPRNITLASQISGTGNFGVVQSGILTLTGAGNTFGGTWVVGGTDVSVGGVSYSNSSLRISTLHASSANSLGVNSSIVANDYSILKIDYDWTTTGSLSLGANSKLFLDNDLIVSSFSINGTDLGFGTFTYDFLNTNYDAFFDTAGLGGSITVIPEPSTYSALLGAAALGLMLGLRRRRQR